MARQRYTLAEAQRNLSVIVDGLHKTSQVELTRRGKPIAVVVSVERFQNTPASCLSFWDAVVAFRERKDFQSVTISPETWKGLRDRSPGREVEL